MAAAVAGNASVIVTWNRTDFPAADLARYGIQVMDPDEYLCELLVELPNEVIDTVVRIAGEKRRPSMTAFDLCDNLRNAGVEGFSVRLRNHLDLRRTVPEPATSWDSTEAPVIAPATWVPTLPPIDRRSSMRSSWWCHHTSRSVRHHISCRPMEIAMFLVAGAQTILGRDPGDGYTLHIFNNHLAEESDEA